MVSWARENAAYNQLTTAPIRWIVDDAVKFLKREIKRGSDMKGLFSIRRVWTWQQGEVFKIERDIDGLLHLCRELLSPKSPFLPLYDPHAGDDADCHEPSHATDDGKQIWPYRNGEMILLIGPGIDVPSGSFARWISQ